MNFIVIPDVASEQVNKIGALAIERFRTYKSAIHSNGLHDDLRHLGHPPVMIGRSRWNNLLFVTRFRMFQMWQRQVCVPPLALDFVTIEL